MIFWRATASEASGETIIETGVELLGRLRGKGLLSLYAAKADWAGC
jgi:hypothetical protein